MGDIDKGRIFRMAPPGAKYVVPKLDFSTVDGAIAALKSPNHDARYLAWMALHKFGGDAETALAKMFHDDPNLTVPCPGLVAPEQTSRQGRQLPESRGAGTTTTT